MTRRRFPIDSDLLELLLAFEEARGLADLSKTMCRDATVVSKNLLRLAESVPVMKKNARRWQMTETGVRVNELTRKYLSELSSILGDSSQSVLLAAQSSSPVLIVLNAQKAYSHPSFGRRTNPGAEEKIKTLLSLWRSSGRNIIHVRHESQNPSSLFFVGSETAEFLPEICPAGDELVIKKSLSSAFSNAHLERELRQKGASSFFLVGFTAAECIDATAKDGRLLGFEPSVICDATVTFDATHSRGEVRSADEIEEAVFANLHNGYANLFYTEEVLNSFGSSVRL